MRFAVLMALLLALGTAGLPAQEKIHPATSKCCMLMKQDGCDQQPVNSSEQPQCCPACLICFALPAVAGAPFVSAPTGKESFALLSVTPSARPEQPELPPPRPSAS